jgi:hypothetical protein
VITKRSTNKLISDSGRYIHIYTHKQLCNTNFSTRNKLKLQSSGVIKLSRLRWARHVARMGERRGAYRALVGKPERRRPLGRPWRRREDNIKMDLRKVGWGHELD